MTAHPFGAIAALDVPVFRSPLSTAEQARRRRGVPEAIRAIVACRCPASREAAAHELSRCGFTAAEILEHMPEHHHG